MVAPDAVKGTVITTVSAEDQDPPVSKKVLLILCTQEEKIFNPYKWPNFFNNKDDYYEFYRMVTHTFVYISLYFVILDRSCIYNGCSWIWQISDTAPLLGKFLESSLSNFTV